MKRLSVEEKDRREQEKKEKKLQLENKRKEREEQKARIQNERQLKRLSLEKEKEEKRLRLEQEKKEKEEKRLKRKEKRIQLEKAREEKLREKERIKQEKLLEIKTKSEEKKKKEEEKLRKLEEKKLAEEKQQKKKARESQLFVGFFKKNSQDSLNSRKSITTDDEIHNSLFLPFQLQPFQSLAEIIPTEKKLNFNKINFEQNTNNYTGPLYLQELKHRHIKKQCRSKIQQDSQESADVVMLDDNCSKMFYRVKYFFFHTDIRPPYFGTWRKRSNFVTGRRPFFKDNFLNYEIDSEEEWEDEEPGESISDSNSEGSRYENDDFEMDEFCVPHGHLSDEEEKMDMDELNQKPHTLFKESDLMKERNKKIEKLKPLVIGCYWYNSDGNNENKNNDHFKILSSYKVVYIDT